MSGSSDYSRDLFDYGVDFRARRVFLHGYLGPTSDENPYNPAERVIRALLALNRTADPIELWINSGGGSVVEAFAIHDVIRALDAPVITVGNGEVSSAATLLIACGTGKRYATANAVFMSHEGETELGSGSLALQQIELAETLRQTKIWSKLMGRYTRPKRSATWWERSFKEIPALYLDARGMLKAGIVDEVMEDNHRE